MQRILRLRPSPAMAVAVAALIVALGGAAYANGSGPLAGASSGDVHGCLSLPSRVIYVPAKGFRCHPSDLPISWSKAGQRGPKGSAGAKGTTGAQGPQGTTGAPGATGQIGSKGEAGQAGLAGLPGQPSKGETGLTGEQGAMGAEGPEGEKGETGSQGPKGEKGEPGLVGEKGEKGETGILGYQVVTNSETIFANGGGTSLGQVFATCPAGKVVIGGGGHAVGGDLVNDGPSFFGGEPNNEWEAEFTFTLSEGSGENETLTAIAYCADKTG